MSKCHKHRFHLSGVCVCVSVNRCQNNQRDTQQCVCLRDYFVMRVCVRALLQYMQIVFHAWQDGAYFWSSVRTSVCHCLTNDVTRSHTHAVAISDATQPEVDLQHAHQSAYINMSRSWSFHFSQPGEEAVSHTLPAGNSKEEEEEV